ncbi:unnamed protein product [Danaus chrysippus]|uniref:(African queen) hypothetical protein n=1 Tax=Danaus chrysippus TaxID=151541 RepID=A0A8J2VYB3_9NEOP|nr:unnamed protein product [Danaus chrysippus]
MLFAPIAVEAMKCKEENCESVSAEGTKTIHSNAASCASARSTRLRYTPAEAVLQAAPQPPSEPLAFRQQPLWQFPPPLPPPYVYPHDQDNLMQPIGNERASFRSLRKNIGGRWKRLVKKKPEQEVYTIPPELKPQLKQIYVY